MFTSTTPGAEDFSLHAASPAKHAADNGLDMGAFAAYPQTAFGCDTNVQLSGVLVEFEDAISSVDRDSDVHIELRLSAPSVRTVSVDIVPIAGDAVMGSDFHLSASTLTFLPGETTKTLTVTAMKTKSDGYDEIVAFGLNNTTDSLPGARSIHVLRINKMPLPIAYAGQDQTIWDADDNGSEGVMLDGSASTYATSYLWSEGGMPIATGEKPTVNLAVGVHVISLEVADDEGNADTTEVTIEIVEKTGIWLEAECGTVGSLWRIEPDEEASHDEYVTIASDHNSTDTAPSDPAGHLTYTFEVGEDDVYTLYARVICPSENDDSLWIKMDNGSFVRWNGITSSTSWTWAEYHTTHSLDAGTHTLTIGYREDGTLLDKLWITRTGADLTDEGPPADNCGVNPGIGYQESGGIVSMEAEDATLGSRWITGSHANASNGEYIEVDSQYDHPADDPEGTTSEYLAAYEFNLLTRGDFRFWFRMYSVGGNDDSFFWRIDGGSWNLENTRSGIGTWFSTDNTQVDNLDAGAHVLEIAYRENGTRLDKFVIQLDSLADPNGEGPAESATGAADPPTAAPAGLVAASGDEQIELVWDSVSGAASYGIKRSLHSGGPYDLISTVPGTGFVDSGLVNGVAYYYIVAAASSGGEGPYSDEAVAMPSVAIAPEEYHLAGHAIADGTNLTLTVSKSVPGHLYQVLSTDSLTQPDWQPDGSAQVGDGSGMVFDLSPGGNPASRFYRLDVQRQ